MYQSRERMAISGDPTIGRAQAERLAVSDIL